MENFIFCAVELSQVTQHYLRLAKWNWLQYSILEITYWKLDIELQMRYPLLAMGFWRNLLLALKSGRSTIIIRQNKDNTNDANVHLAQK